jgi:hypothetical protein
VHRVGRLPHGLPDDLFGLCLGSFSGAHLGTSAPSHWSCALEAGGKTTLRDAPIVDGRGPAGLEGHDIGVWRQQQRTQADRGGLQGSLPRRRTAEVQVITQ